MIIPAQRAQREVSKFLLTAKGRRLFRTNRSLRRALLIAWLAAGSTVPVVLPSLDGSHRHTCHYDQRFIVVPCTDGHVEFI